MSAGSRLCRRLALTGASHPGTCSKSSVGDGSCSPAGMARGCFILTAAPGDKEVSSVVFHFSSSQVPAPWLPLRSGRRWLRGRRHLLGSEEGAESGAEEPRGSVVDTSIIRAFILYRLEFLKEFRGRGADVIHRACWLRACACVVRFHVVQLRCCVVPVSLELLGLGMSSRMLIIKKQLRKHTNLICVSNWSLEK